MIRACRFLLFPLWICALVSVAAAADADGMLYPGRATPVGVPTGGGLGNFALLAGLGLAAVGGWLVWRGRRSPRAGDALRSLTLAETRSLGNRQYLVVAAYDNKKFLLGVCPNRIELLAPLHDDPPAR